MPYTPYGARLVAAVSKRTVQTVQSSSYSLARKAHFFLFNSQCYFRQEETVSLALETKNIPEIIMR